MYRLLVVLPLALRDLDVLERLEGREERAADPGRVLPLLRVAPLRGPAGAARDAARAVAQAPLELILQTAAKAGQHGRAAGQHDVLGELDLQVLVAQLQGRRDERLEVPVVVARPREARAVLVDLPDFAVLEERLRRQSPRRGVHGNDRAIGELDLNVLGSPERARLFLRAARVVVAQSHFFGQHSRYRRARALRGRQRVRYPKSLEDRHGFRDARAHV